MTIKERFIVKGIEVALELAGFTVLFSIDWRIASGVFLLIWSRNMKRYQSA